VIEMVYDACIHTCDPRDFNGNVENKIFCEESFNGEA